MLSGKSGEGVGGSMSSLLSVDILTTGSDGLFCGRISGRSGSFHMSSVCISAFWRLASLRLFPLVSNIGRPILTCEALTSCEDLSSLAKFDACVKRFVYADLTGSVR